MSTLTCQDLMNEVYGFELLTPDGRPVSETCDTIKTGDPDRILRRVAVACMPTVRVLKAAAEWNADLLIVHEPLFYNHMDSHFEGAVGNEKKKLLDSLSMSIYRIHDHQHRAEVDKIAEGELYYMGLLGKGRFGERIRPAINEFILDQPTTARELALLIEDKLGVRHVRIIGNPNFETQNLLLSFGAGGGLYEAFTEGKYASGRDCLALTGETCEWREAEYLRDAAALGINQAELVLGHMGSERHGMEYLARELSLKHRTDFDVRYLDCGEVYTYPETR